MNMEFLDFTGTNEEEKAQALDIISHDSSGVEFYSNNSSIDNYNFLSNHHLHYYNNNNHHQNNIDNGDNEHSNNKSSTTTTTTSYLHINGDIVPGGQNSSTSSNHAHINNHQSSQTNQNHHQNHHQRHHHQQQQHQQQHHLHHHPNSAMIDNSQINHHEWDSNHQQESTQPNMNAPPPHPQYTIFPPGPAGYFPPPPGPPNHYSIATLHPGPPPPPPPPPLGHAPKPTMAPCMPPIMPTSSNGKNPSSKNNTVNNQTSSCDIRSSIYMPPPSQYSDASMMDNHNRLKNSVSGDGSGNMMSDSQLVSNGTAVAAVAPPPHPHLGPQYPAYAFTPTQALTFPPHPHHYGQPIYLTNYIAHDSFIHYPTFSPSTAATHISPIPPAAHHPNVITTNVDFTYSNANNQTNSSCGATAPSTTATLSNLSSMSASSSSIPAAYHSSVNSSASDTPVYESNENFYTQQSDESDPVENLSPNTSTSEENPETTDPPSQVPSNSIEQQDEPKAVEAPQPVDAATVSDVQTYLKNYLNISSSNTNNAKQPNEIVESVAVSKTESAQAAETLENNSTANESAEPKSIPETIKPSQPVLSSVNNAKPTTWASKLFPTTAPISLNNNQIENNQTITSKSSENDLKISSDNANLTTTNHVEVKSPNNEFPELNTNSKTSNNHNSSNSRRSGGRFANNHDDDYKKLTIISMKNDHIALKLAKRLRDSIHLKHSLPTIMPCGLINRGNWCYVNATLQALLACPPFYNLMREISETSGLFRQSTSTPIIDNFARYFLKFLPTDFKRQMKSAGSPYLEELLNSDPFEPVFIYDTLKHIGMIKNDAQRGHQEDAEEFLSSVLNGLNEEMINLSKLLTESSAEKAKTATGKTNGFSSNSPNERLTDFEDGIGHEDDGVQDSNEIWHEVGTSKHKSLPTRSAKITTTPITEIFGGSTLDIRTVNKDKDSCGNRQPFFTLQLDIKPSAIKTLDDAIRWQTKSETIYGYTCSKTKQVVDASSQMFLENLPPILIFHLKLFDYDIETGASKKLLKTIDFPENFDIPRECLTGKIDNRCRRYKLLAVVYHNGSEVINGHYITDVYHLGLNHWLRCDDAAIKVISLSKVLNGNDREGSVVPYLLFYRRYDTLHGNNNSNNNSLSSIQSNSGSNNNNNAALHYGSSSKRASSNSNHNTNNSGEFGQNHHYHHNNNNSHHDQHHHHHQNDLMLTSNKFSSISR